MYEIYVRFKSFPGKRESFVEALHREGIISEIRAEKGCIRYDYYFSEKDPNELLLIEQWESQEHQKVHIVQPHMERLREMKEEYIETTTLGEFSTQ
ncbi:MAG: antibiotic biosynthesis monooxygenase [Ruminococcaceae bacterium]|nr:antibiotic biosynthesis monooxygenase [Oscillospiraceae bacterium]